VGGSGEGVSLQSRIGEGPLELFALPADLQCLFGVASGKGEGGVLQSKRHLQVQVPLTLGHGRAGRSQVPGRLLEPPALPVRRSRDQERIDAVGAGELGRLVGVARLLGQVGGLLEQALV
jgi:hypothetical protein